VVWVEAFNGLYKDYNPHAAAFSEDNSILAVTFDSKVTLWNTSTYQLFDILDCLPTSDKLTHVTFINSSGAYLVAASPDRISVWNLITNSGIVHIDIESPDHLRGYRHSLMRIYLQCSLVVR